MGLKLQGIPARAATAQELAGRTVAIDAPNLLYAFYAVQLLRVEATPERRADALRSAQRGLLQRVRDLAAVGARSVVILDGPPHPGKVAHLVLREATRSVPAIRAAEYVPIAEALRAQGVPVLQAPHDAEAQACAMAARGLVDVVATTDWDALAMGAPRLLRNLSASPQKREGRRWSLVEADDALRALGATRERLAAAAVLMGCDYFPGFAGVGPKRALRLVAEGDPAAALTRVIDARAVAPGEREAALLAYRLLVEPPWVEPPPAPRGRVQARLL